MSFAKAAPVRLEPLKKHGNDLCHRGLSGDLRDEGDGSNRRDNAPFKTATPVQGVLRIIWPIPIHDIRIQGLDILVFYVLAFLLVRACASFLYIPKLLVVRGGR